MQTARAATVALALAGLAFSARGIRWDSDESAPGKAASTGKPIFYYFANNAVEREGAS